MPTVLTVGLGYERLIYTASVNLRNKHKDKGWDAPYRTVSTNIPSFYYSRQNIDRDSFQTVPLV